MEPNRPVEKTNKYKVPDLPQIRSDLFIEILYYQKDRHVEICREIPVQMMKKKYVNSFYEKRALRDTLKHYLDYDVVGDNFPFINIGEAYRLKHELSEPSPIPKLGKENEPAFNNILRFYIQSDKTLDLREGILKVIEELWKTPVTSFEFPYSNDERDYWLIRNHEVYDSVAKAVDEGYVYNTSFNDYNDYKKCTKPGKADFKRITVNEFIKKVCVENEDNPTKSEDVYRRYLSWMSLEYPEEEPATKSLLGRYLNKNFKRRRYPSGNGYYVTFLKVSPTVKDFSV